MTSNDPSRPFLLNVFRLSGIELPNSKKSGKFEKLENLEKLGNSRNETEKVKSTSLQKPTEYRKEIRHEFNQQRGVYPEEVNR